MASFLWEGRGTRTWFDVQRAVLAFFVPFFVLSCHTAGTRSSWASEYNLALTVYHWCDSVKCKSCAVWLEGWQRLGGTGRGRWPLHPCRADQNQGKVTMAARKTWLLFPLIQGLTYQFRSWYRGDAVGGRGVTWSVGFPEGPAHDTEPPV